MECTKKDLVWFTIINFLLVVIAIACVICMDFSMLSLILAIVSLLSIVVSSSGILQNAKELRK